MTIEIEFSYSEQYQPIASGKTGKLVELTEFLMRNLRTEANCMKELNDIQRHDLADNKRTHCLLEEGPSRSFIDDKAVFVWLTHLDWQDWMDGELLVHSRTELSLQQYRTILQAWQMHLKDKPVSKRSSRSAKYRRKIQV